MTERGLPTPLTRTACLVFAVEWHNRVNERVWTSKLCWNNDAFVILSRVGATYSRFYDDGELYIGRVPRIRHVPWKIISERFLSVSLCVCVSLSVSTVDNYWTVRGIITKFPGRHSVVEREVKFENGCIGVRGDEKASPIVLVSYSNTSWTK